jgi:hypothetical protein
MENGKKKPIVYVDPELLDLIPKFMENKIKDVENLKKFNAEKNFLQIEKIGHSLKGTGLSFGFTDVSRLGLELEVAAKGKDPALIEKLIEEFAGYLNTVEIRENKE